MTYEKIYTPCDDCQYNFSRNNQETGMCDMCEFKQLLKADVVPRSEYPCCVKVDNGLILTKSLDDYDALIGDISEATKQEVAEEILNFVVTEMSKYANDITLSDVIRGLMTEVMTDILNHIDKKYIGE